MTSGPYVYRDAVGEPVYRVVRRPPKRFYQERYEDGRWVSGLDGVLRVPYRLPQLLAAADEGDPAVWVVEGEKDADRLTQLGLVSTTNAGGAVWSWPDDWAEHFHGCERVYVVPDNDPKGREAAQHRAGVISQAVHDVRIVDLADVSDKGDVSDWLDAGGTVDSLERLGDAAPSYRPAADAGANDAPGEQGRPSQATQLCQLAETSYRFTCTPSGEPFAVSLAGSNLARMLRGGRHSLRAELAAAYAEVNGRVPSSTALADAMAVLEGKAQRCEPVGLGLRVAGHGDGIVLDLGNSTGRVVVIEPGGWRVENRSPVLFRRTELTGELPVPEQAGRLEHLADLLNVAPASWDLLRGWLVAALHPDIPHPALLLGGEQGTGKSTAERLLAATVDPSPAQLRSSPRDIEQWSVAASGSWVVPLDNVSTIQPWLSDALCRAVTGDGFLKRRLYADNALTVLAFKRVVILSAIDPGALRGDLADRLLLIDLERIPPKRRRLDTDLDAAFRTAHGGILGGLLDLLAEVLRVLPNIHLDELPRMADFAKVLAAVDEIEGTSALATYVAQSERIATEVVEGDPLAEAVRGFAHKEGEWSGTAGELLKAIKAPDPAPRDWPTNAKSLAAGIRRCAPALRTVGVGVDYDSTGRRRRWTVRYDTTGQDDPESNGANGAMAETLVDKVERRAIPPAIPATTASSNGRPEAPGAIPPGQTSANGSPDGGAETTPDQGEQYSAIAAIPFAPPLGGHVPGQAKEAVEGPGPDQPAGHCVTSESEAVEMVLA